MILNFDELLWGDSVLEKIEIVNDKISILIYNDVSQKEVYIDCLQCVGMTELIIWDENIIDFIGLKKIGNTDHYLSDKAVKLYGKESLNYNKKLCDNLCLLKIVFIDKTYFEVVCNEVLIRDSIFDADRKIKV